MRIAATVTLTAIAVAVSAAALAATPKPAPRLTGRFTVQATITTNNLAGVKDGTRSSDVYTFTATCRRGVCATVTLVRAGGSARKNYRSTLRRIGPGRYQGTEGPYAYPCQDRTSTGRPTFTARHTIQVTRSSRGQVTAFTGQSRYALANCRIGTAVDYRLSGTLKR